MCRYTRYRPAFVVGRVFAAAAAFGLACATLTGRAEEPKPSIALSVTIVPRTDDAGGLMPVEPGQVAMTAETVLKRLRKMGYSKARIESKTAKGFHVRISDVPHAESSKIASALQKVARLELKEVHLRSDEIVSAGKTLARRVIDGEEIVPGYRAYMHKLKDEDGNELSRPILLSRRVAVSGNDIALAAPSPHEKDALWVTLNAKGTEKMVALTKNMKAGDQIAILLDGEVISAPSLADNGPLGKNFQISGLREPGEVETLALALMCPLELPILVEELPAKHAPAKAE